MTFVRVIAFIGTLVCIGLTIHYSHLWQTDFSYNYTCPYSCVYLNKNYQCEVCSTNGPTYSCCAKYEYGCYWGCALMTANPIQQIKYRTAAYISCVFAIICAILCCATKEKRILAPEQTPFIA